MLAPLLRQIVRTENGEALELLGVDVFAMPRPARRFNFNDRNGSADGSLMGFAFPPFQLWAAPPRLEQLSAKNNSRIRLTSGELLPPAVAISNQQLGHRLLIDIGALQSLIGNRKGLTSMLVFPASSERMTNLYQALPDYLEYVSNSETPDPAQLTRSFHLNLAAMGLLAFVVGIFLTYNALAFSYTDRRDLIRKLRLAGVMKGELARALIVELTFFLIAGALIGSWLGAQMAAWLLPGVGRTLAQLYGVYITYPDGLVPSGIWLPFLMTVVAAGLCVLFPLRESLNAPMLERKQAGWQHDTVVRRDRLMAVTGFLLLAAALVAGLITTHLWLALAGIACLLLGAALLLPSVLRLLISVMAKLVPAKNVRFSWLLADSRWLLGPASVALMAMTLALIANSGLNTMINSFRQATDDWLGQRLVADLYLRGENRSVELETWLAATMPELTVTQRYRTAITRPGPGEEPVAVEVVSLQEGERFRNSVKLMHGNKEAVTQFENGEGIYISERAWRIDGWQTGASLNLCKSHTKVPVLGVYRDYGNPKSQWMVNRQLFRNCWPELTATGLAVYGAKDYDWGGVRLAIAEKFELQDDEIINQTELKQVGLAVFDRTFAVTRALNALTLLVAAIGIFCAISAIHHHRVGQQALLASLGLSRRERGSLLLLQWGMLGLLCMVLVWPLGTLLAAYLGMVVTPAAFGWSFPLQLDWQHYLVLAAMAAASLVLAVILPSLRLLYTSPAAMLREQNV
jgi:putative ABC transport system permease protein